MTVDQIVRDAAGVQVVANPVGEVAVVVKGDLVEILVGGHAIERGSEITFEKGSKTWSKPQRSMPRRECLAAVTLRRWINHRNAAPTAFASCTRNCRRKSSGLRRGTSATTSTSRSGFTRRSVQTP